MDKPAEPAELEILSEPWRPIRSAAARLLWHDYLTSRGRSEPAH
jgi:3-methyladenine DNA glycosylase/8-oxoguanine DNA glycosylase